MKFCQPHWSELRSAIHDRGLNALIPQGGVAAAKAMATGTFDPLMAAHNMILSNALEKGGFQILMGDACPLCYVQHHHDHCAQPACEKPTASEWITNASDGSLAYAREHKLIGDPS